jgi:DNA polymerase III subunit delta'
MVLDDILGHTRVRDGLKTAAATDTVHHAMLFSGPDGVGKSTVAKAFAALAACPTPTSTGDACGSCRSCDRILNHVTGEETRHPDVLWLSPQSSAVIKIAQVRNLLGIIPYPPLEARVRTVIIEPADALNVEAANALLKTLEEPPSSTRFILITSRPDALLTTIRSRCQSIHFGRLSDEHVERGLRDAGIGPEQAKRGASLADGSLGVALERIDDPILAAGDEILERCIATRPGDATAAFRLAADLADPKEQVPQVLEVLLRFYRDALLLSVDATERVGLTHPHLADSLLKTVVERLGTEAILHRLALITDTQRAMTSRNIPGLLSLERLLVAILAPPGREGATPALDR